MASDHTPLTGEAAAAPAQDAPPPPPSRRILVAVDESEESSHALSWAVDHLILPYSAPDAFRSSAEVILLHVQSHPQIIVGPAGPGYPPAGFYVTPEILESVRKSQEEISRKVLLRAKKICEERHILAETMIAVGDPRDGICEAVEKLNVTYLVVGSHGYGAIKRAFLGSVSDYCAHNAKCPVVIVKKK